MSSDLRVATAILKTQTLAIPPLKKELGCSTQEATGSLARFIISCFGTQFSCYFQASSVGSTYIKMRRHLIELHSELEKGEGLSKLEKRLADYFSSKPLFNNHFTQEEFIDQEIDFLLSSLPDLTHLPKIEAPYDLSWPEQLYAFFEGEQKIPPSLALLQFSTKNAALFFKPNHWMSWHELVQEWNTLTKQAENFLTAHPFYFIQDQLKSQDPRPPASSWIPGNCSFRMYVAARTINAIEFSLDFSIPYDIKHALINDFINNDQKRKSISFFTTHDSLSTNAKQLVSDYKNPSSYLHPDLPAIRSAQRAGSLKQAVKRERIVEQDKDGSNKNADFCNQTLEDTLIVFRNLKHLFDQLDPSKPRDKQAEEKIIRWAFQENQNPCQFEIPEYKKSSSFEFHPKKWADDVEKLRPLFDSDDSFNESAFHILFQVFPQPGASLFTECLLFCNQSSFMKITPAQIKHAAYLFPGIFSNQLEQKQQLAKELTKRLQPFSITPSPHFFDLILSNTPDPRTLNRLALFEEIAALKSEELINGDILSKALMLYLNGEPRDQGFAVLLCQQLTPFSISTNLKLYLFAHCNENISIAAVLYCLRFFKIDQSSKFKLDNFLQVVKRMRDCDQEMREDAKEDFKGLKPCSLDEQLVAFRELLQVQLEG